MRVMHDLFLIASIPAILVRKPCVFFKILQLICYFCFLAGGGKSRSHFHRRETTSIHSTSGEILYSSLRNRHRPYVYYFFIFFQALYSYQRVHKGYLDGYLLDRICVFKALWLFFLQNFPGPTLIPCPTSIQDSRVLIIKCMLSVRNQSKTFQALKVTILGQIC